ncbi:MAG: hypothetical protein U5K32_09895 [Bacteroidales bacterium]|nr:hypothetical protein [Bacteroidales bacterium]
MNSKQENIPSGKKWAFTKRALVFVFIVFLADLVVGLGLRYYYFRQESGQLYRTTYSVDSTEAGAIIFGSSRANHHYKPPVLADKLGMEVYNAGREGNFMFYHYGVLSAVLERHTPEIVILDFVRGEFMYKRSSYDRLSSLLPYYRTHPEMRETIRLKSDYEPLKLVSRIYPFNSMILTIAAANAGLYDSEEVENGYIPLYGEWKEKIDTTTVPDLYNIDSVAVETYRSFLSDCVSSGVEVYVFCSPVFINYAYDDSSVEIGRRIADELGVRFFDLSNERQFISDPCLYWDVYHLNDRGAEHYSALVADIISGDDNRKISINIE